MYRVLLAIVLTTSAVAWAQVFKWVDAEGRTQFSDRPHQDAETVSVPSPQPSGKSAESVSTGDQVETPLLGAYSAFEIQSPEPNQTLRQARDDLPISLLIDPPLMAGHVLELVLNGTPVRVDPSTGTQIALNGVAYGSHRAYAQIRDPQGAIIARTVSLTFHLRKPAPPGVIR